MPPTSQQTQASLQGQRRGLPLGPYPGPYAFPYPGQMRPYPEPRPRRRREPQRPPRIPAVAAAAGLLALAGVPPLVMVVISAVSQRSSGGDAGIDWWLYLLLAFPVLEAGGAWWLLTGRGRMPLLLTCLPGAALFFYVVWARFAGPVDLRPSWTSLALICPLIAIALGLLPATAAWVSARRRFAAAHPAA